MLAEGSGRSGREALALLRTAISREWLVLIALISGGEAKPAVQRPRLAPGAPGKEEQRETLQNFGGPFSLEGPAAVGAGDGGQLGAGRPGDRWGQARLADSSAPRAHVPPPVEPTHFLMSLIKFSPVSPTLRLLSGQRDCGTVCPNRA